MHMALALPLVACKGWGPFEERELGPQGLGPPRVEVVLLGGAQTQVHLRLGSKKHHLQFAVGFS